MMYRILFYMIVGMSYARAFIASDPEKLMVAHFWSFVCMVIFCPIFPYNQENPEDE